MTFDWSRTDVILIALLCTGALAGALLLIDLGLTALAPVFSPACWHGWLTLDGGIVIAALVCVVGSSRWAASERVRRAASHAESAKPED